MKKIVTLAFGILVSLIAIEASAQQLPKSGAALKASDTSIEIANGQSQEIEINRLRSKSYNKAKFGSIQINTPDGITAEVKNDESNPDMYYVSLATSSDVSAGKYTLTIQGEGRNASKVKGTMISVTVSDDGTLAAQN